jgi:hypothetical protein
MTEEWQALLTQDCIELKLDRSNAKPTKKELWH